MKLAFPGDTLEIWRVLSWHKSIKGRCVLTSLNKDFGARYQAGHSNICCVKKWIDVVVVPHI